MRARGPENDALAGAPHNALFVVWAFGNTRLTKLGILELTVSQTHSSQNRA
jgi:hypothetical protein